MSSLALPRRQAGRAVLRRSRALRQLLDARLPGVAPPIEDEPLVGRRVVAAQQVVARAHEAGGVFAEQPVQPPRVVQHLLQVLLLSRGVAECYYESRESLGFPLIKKEAGNE